MPSPFPGMDPYLEAAHKWPGVHMLYIGVCMELLNRQLRPRYVAEVEERVYLTPDDSDTTLVCVPDIWIERRGGKAKPAPEPDGAVAVAEPLVLTTLADDETHERRVEIRATDTRQLVAVIELLSPANKASGSEGRRSFLAKRREVTSSPAHWVEIDLLRRGESLPLRRLLRPHEYFAHVSPVEMRPQGRVWAIRLQSRLPVITIPLRAPDPDATLDLQAALDTVYDRGAYDLKLDYTTDADPPLTPELAKWAKKITKPKKAR